MKILLTGAAGQLGRSFLAQQALHPRAQVLATDVAQLDLTSLEAVDAYFDAQSPQIVVNTAAYTAVDKAESEPQAAYRINVEAVEHLVQACARHGAYFIHISTDYVFDGEATTPYQPTDAPRPQSVYGRTKAQGEAAALRYARSLVLRTSWLYAPDGRNFPATMLRLFREGGPVRVVNDQWGCPTYAPHLAQALWTVVDRLCAPPAFFYAGILHFADAPACSWFDLARAVHRLCASQSPLLPIPTSQFPTAACRPAYSVLDCSRFTEIYGLRPRPWIQGLEAWWAQQFQA